MKSRGSGKFLLILFFFLSEIVIMSYRRFMSRESLKLIWIQAEDDVMKSCFYCKKCEKCGKFYKIMNECKTKGFLGFNKKVKCREVMYTGKSKQIVTVFFLTIKKREIN